MTNRVATWFGVVAILGVGLALRVRDLGGPSFWYDEVVTMRLAETPSTRAMVDLLFRIDATRAPLHPVILQGWLGAFGSSEAAARALSVAFGMATIALLYPLGRLAFDRSTGVWAMGLGSFSPLLVYYSREVRMYALLTFLATLAWTLLFGMRGTPGPRKTAGYILALGAMLLTHPLGLLMWGALAAASALDARGIFGSRRAWAGVHFGVLAALAPWLRNYFDHAPEFLSGRLPIRFLLGTPIGFLGGTFATLAATALLIGYGLARRRRAADRPPRAWIAPAFLACWLVLPPTVLYAYSWVASPVFGPSRYTVFCAPAFLVLVAQALAKLPPLSCRVVAPSLVAIAAAYPPSMPPRASWRECAATAQVQFATLPGTAPVLFVASDAEPNVEAETARYYLGRWCRVLPFDAEELDRLRRDPSQAVYLAYGSRSRQTPPRSVMKAADVVFRGGNRSFPAPPNGPFLWRLMPLTSPARPASAPAPAPEAPGP